MGRPKTKSTAICGARLVWLALVLELVRGLQGAPALYMFGDWQLDVGNNNYVDVLTSGLFKANHPRYGVDYPGEVATGRFSNGHFPRLTLWATTPALRHIAPSPTPQETPPACIFLKGDNFAYGGARVSDQNLLRLSGGSNNLRQQIERDYSSVHAQLLVQQLGETQANAHLASSIFVIAVGSTDIVERALYYAVEARIPDDEDYQEFPERLARAFERHLISGDAQGVLVVGTGPLSGATRPALRLLRESNTTRCSQEVNQVSARYHTAVDGLLQHYSSTWDDLRYSFVDRYTVLQEYIDKPAANGYADVEEACCDDPGSPAVFPICSQLCPDRRDHMFWDALHLT